MYVVCQLHSSRKDSTPLPRKITVHPLPSWGELHSCPCFKKNHLQGQLSPWASPVCTVSPRHEIPLPDRHLKQGQKDLKNKKQKNNYNLLLLLPQSSKGIQHTMNTCNIPWCKRGIVQSVKCCVGNGKYRHRHRHRHSQTSPYSSKHIRIIKSPLLICHLPPILDDFLTLNQVEYIRVQWVCLFFPKPKFLSICSHLESAKTCDLL